MVKTVIFDMDGVLIDSEPIHKSINQVYFEEIGVPVSDQDYEDHFVGLPLEQMFVQLQAHHSLPGTVEELLAVCGRRIYRGFEEADLKAAQGVDLLLQELSVKKLNMAIGSSSSQKLIRLVSRKIGVHRYFTHLVSGYEVEKGKPHPDLFLHIAGLFGSDPQDCLVIEDSSLGVDASHRAGMKTVGVRNVSSGIQNLDKADWIVDDFSSDGRALILDVLSR